MSDLIAIIQWITENHKSLTRRVLPTLIVIVFFVLYQLLGVDQYVAKSTNFWIKLALLIVIISSLAFSIMLLPHDKRFINRINRLLSTMQYEKAEMLLACRRLFVGIVGNIRLKMVLAQAQIDKGNLSDAYDIICDIEKSPLLPTELQELRLVKAELMLLACNYERFYAEMSLINIDFLKKSGHKNQYFLLASRQEEIKGDYTKAKRTLEQALAVSASDLENALAYNNLARLEERSNHLTFALSYYEKAWELLQKTKTIDLYNTIGHNLMILYARSGNSGMAREVLNKIESYIDKRNPEQYLIFINEKMNFARQIEDKNLIDLIYEEINIDLISQINDRKRFMLEVSNLRMRLSDNYGFEKHFEYLIMKRLPTQQLTKDEGLQVYRELWVAYTQGMSRLSDDILKKSMPIIINGLIDLESYVDQKLRSISPELPSIRSHFFGHKLAIIKVKLFGEERYHGCDGHWQQLISELFKMLEEKCSLRIERINVDEEIEILINFIDEYLSYKVAIKAPLTNKLKMEALNKLDRIENILINGWPYPGRVHYAIAFSYLNMALTGDVTKSKYWINLYDDQYLSLSHHMEWLRKWYYEVKDAIDRK